MQLPIRTERLRLRLFEDADVPDILEYSSSSDFWLARNLPWEVTEEGIATFWSEHRDVDLSQRPDWLCLVVELEADDKVVGHVDIAVFERGDHTQGAIGWLLGRAHQGHGFATEAVTALLGVGFEQLGLHRITARTGKENRRSWYLMERVGMRREAHFRHSHKVRGQWSDELVYAILAEEWGDTHEETR